MVSHINHVLYLLFVLYLLLYFDISVRRSEDGVFDGVVNKVKLYNAILTERYK